MSSAAVHVWGPRECGHVGTWLQGSLSLTGKANGLLTKCYQHFSCGVGAWGGGILLSLFGFLFVLFCVFHFHITLTTTQVLSQKPGCQPPNHSLSYVGAIRGSQQSSCIPVGRNESWGHVVSQHPAPSAAQGMAVHARGGDVEPEWSVPSPAAQLTGYKCRHVQVSPSCFSGDLSVHHERQGELSPSRYCLSASDPRRQKRR